MLLVGDRVVLRSPSPPDAEYGLFEIGDIELRASEPGRVREHGYQTTAERARTRCDVFWSNEFAQMVSLANDGLLAAYDSPSAAEIPAGFRDPGRRWTGFAARARVFIVNTELGLWLGFVR